MCFNVCRNFLSEKWFVGPAQKGGKALCNVAFGSWAASRAQSMLSFPWKENAGHENCGEGNGLEWVWAVTDHHFGVPACANFTAAYASPYYRKQAHIACAGCLIYEFIREHICFPSSYVVAITCWSSSSSLMMFVLDADIISSCSPASH